MRWNWKTILGILFICGAIKEFSSVIHTSDVPLVFALISAVIVIACGVILIRWGNKKKNL